MVMKDVEEVPSQARQIQGYGIKNERLPLIYMPEAFGEAYISLSRKF